MELKPAICPFCGADLRLPEDKKVLKCMYCGKDVIVHDAIEKAVSPTVENLLTIANSAKNSGNNKEAHEYFTKVLELNPNHYIAWFGKGESAGWLSTIADSRLPEMITGIENAIKFCPEQQREEIKIKGAEAINNVACAYFNLNLQNMQEYGRVSNVGANFYVRCQNIYKAMEIAHSYCPTNTKVIDNIIELFKRQIEGIEYKDYNEYGEIKQISRITPEYEKEIGEKMDSYIQKRQALESTYQPPTIEKKSACFIVTATLGNINHPHVLLLQEFRDEWLSKRSLGRVFIGKYYNYSPRIAEIIRRRKKLSYLSNAFIVKPSAIIARWLLRR